MTSSSSDSEGLPRTPNGRRQLNQLIRNFAQKHSISPNFASALLANCVILVAIKNAGLERTSGLMVKGGLRFALRNQLQASRFTTDLDLSASKKSEIAHIQELSGLQIGGFSIESVKQVSSSRPKHLPEHYAMTRHKIRLLFRGGEFRTVILEANQNELGLDSESTDFELSSQIIELIELAGLQAPATIRVFSSEYQFAQKLHALSAPDSDRGHDLLDLWLLIASEHLDARRVRELVKRTYSIRGTHPFETTLHATALMERTYVSATNDLLDPPSFGTALGLVNEYLEKVFSSSASQDD